MYKKRHELIENLVNQNKNLLTFVSNTPENRTSKIYNHNQKSSFFEYSEAAEKLALERPHTSLDRKPRKGISVETLPGFFRESFNYGQRLKEALETKSKDHSIDKANNSKTEMHSRGKSISIPPTAVPFQRLSFMKPVTKNTRLKSTASSSTTHRRATSF